MARYIVSSLNAQASPRGILLDRINGPGWADTPANLLDHLIHERHEFVLEGTDLRLAARRQQENAWLLIIVDPQGKEIAPESLPHWRVEQLRPPQRPRMNWWQRLIDPDAA